MRLLAILALLTAGVTLAQSPSTSVRADALKAHVHHLASDELQGRATFTPELDLAAAYIAERFKEIGLVPGGNDGYYQRATITRRDGTERTSQNVIGVLRGSDPVLSHTYLIVTAHYDHVGTRANAEGDGIYNGANDDASGVAGVIELARSLSKSKPKRSILFMGFFGEEMGLVGSRYFGKNPTVPLKSIVAHINLEQIGRTDDTEGPRVGKFSMTGHDYTNLSAMLNAAMVGTGVAVEKHPQYSDAFFGRSDNQALADLGIPAHTLCTAFEFPDYHKPTDTWDKLDYDNMAAILSALSLGVLAVANSPEAPRWDASNPKTKRYVEAAGKL